MKSFNLFILTLISLVLLVSVNAATVSHPASEITAGTFGKGDFTIHNDNEVFLSIKNTEAGGHDYRLVSGGFGTGIGLGKFAIYDSIAGQSRLTIDSNGNVGIGTITPKTKLDVDGDVKWTGTLQGGSVPWSRLSSIPSGFADNVDNVGTNIPSGAVMFFNLGSCPSGWSELINARGRYLVGGETVGETVGTALSDQEDRPVGKHSHGVSSGAVGSHVGHCGAPGMSRGSASICRASYGGGGAHSHSIQISSAGAVEGTNAPYIQFLVCQKN